MREKLLNSVSFVKWVISEWLIGIFSEDSLNFGTILAGVGRFIRTGADRLTIVDKWCRDDRIVAIEAPRCVWILKNLIIIYLYHIIKYVKIFQKWIFNSLFHHLTDKKIAGFRAFFDFWWFALIFSWQFLVSCIFRLWILRKFEFRAIINSYTFGRDPRSPFCLTYFYRDF